MSKGKARHFHAGKLRKEIDGVEYVEVAESNGKVFVADTGMVLRNGKLTKGHDNGRGYLTVSIAGHTTYIHRLVFEVFVGQIPDDRELDHINDKRGDNRLENLRVVTHYQNLMEKESSRANRARASRVSIRKAIESQQIPVVAEDTDGTRYWFKSCVDAACTTGVHFTSISQVLHGSSHVSRAGGLKWFIAKPTDKEALSGNKWTQGATRGRRGWQARRIPVSAFSPAGVHIGTWSSVSDALKALESRGVGHGEKSKANVCKVIDKDDRTSLGFKWRTANV